MRPDQHKKKRSTQYKKKHGISDKPKTENSDNNKEKNVFSGGGGGGGAQASKEWQKPNQNNLGKKDTTKSEEKDFAVEDKEREGDVQTSFCRRKLLSNWDRYEPLPPDSEDENPSEIGDDFAKLLSQTANALSQFRFKDEKEWEEDKTLLSSNFVALDCEALANSLQCLPLHERLGLDAALFSGEQLEAFSVEAEKSRALYDPGSCSMIVQEEQTAFDVKAMHSVVSAAMHLVPAILKTVKAPPSTSCHENNAESSERTEENGMLVPGKEESTSTNDDKEEVNKASLTEPKEKKSLGVKLQVPCNPISEEDELDTLLSLGNTKHQTDVNKTEKSADIPVSAGKKYVSDATASLEDWLDSVLDN